MKNSFSFNRIALLSKLYLATNRRILTIMGSITVGILMLYYIMPFMFSLIFSHTINIDAAACAQSSLYILAVMFVVGISTSMTPYFKPRGASASLMLPATNAEKFLLIFVRTLIVNIVILVATSVVVNTLWSLALGQSIDWGVWFSFTLDGWIKEISLLCLLHSLFLFGATLFRRNALLYTILFLLAIMFVIGIVGTLIAVTLRTDMLSIEVAETITRYFLYALTVGLWYFSWRRFTKIQIAK